MKKVEEESSMRKKSKKNSRRLLVPGLAAVLLAGLIACTAAPHVTVKEGSSEAVNEEPNGKDESVHFDVEAPIEIYGGTATFRDLSLSQNSVTVTFDEMVGVPETLPEGTAANDAIQVLLTDGTMINSYYAEEADLLKESGRITLFFDRILDRDEIESVTFAGITVPVTQNSKHVKRTTVDYPELGITIQMPNELLDITTKGAFTNYYNKEIDARGTQLTFTGEKDGQKMVLFYIIAVKSDMSKKDFELASPLMTYMGHENGMLYAIGYGEPTTEEQINTFADIMNEDVATLLPWIIINGK